MPQITEEEAEVTNFRDKTFLLQNVRVSKAVGQVIPNLNIQGAQCVSSGKRGDMAWGQERQHKHYWDTDTRPHFSPENLQSLPHLVFQTRTIWGQSREIT